MEVYDVIVIGGGQSGLAVGYYLRRSGVKFIILDKEVGSGGSWQHHWNSLRLFSPAQWSSLPGILMKGGSDYYPTRDEAVSYLGEYESKYNLPIKRPVEIVSVSKSNEGFRLDTSAGIFLTKTVVSATGSFYTPFIPAIPGLEKFKGLNIHSSAYSSPEQVAGKRVAIVGEGNSGAQILAEVSKAAQTIWVTQKEPRFLPDHIDGRYLFDAATQMYEAQKSGKEFKPPSLGDIVMVDSVKDARTRNVLQSAGSIEYITENSIVLSSGYVELIDAIIFCTGFKYSLDHLLPLGVVIEGGKIETTGTRAKQIDGLWLVGYGNWTGFASATLIGVSRSAKTTVDEIGKYISSVKESQPS